MEHEDYKKHAIKIPSSLGLFIVESSCFFVSGPKVEKRGGRREKRRNSKRLHLQKNKTVKQEKINREKQHKKRCSALLRFSDCVQLKMFTRSTHCFLKR